MKRLISTILFVMAFIIAASGFLYSSELTWTASTGEVTGYRIYYGTTEGSYPLSVEVGGETRYSLDNLNLAENKTYCFVSRAYNESGESGDSNVVEYTVADTTPPLPPQGVNAVLENGGIVVKWSGNSEVDISGYRLYYGISSRTYGPPVTVEGTTYAVTGLNVDTTYYFAVTAVDTAGNESGYSSPEVSQLFPAPLLISTETLADGKVNTRYEASLGAEGGVSPYSWRLKSGSMSAGLTLSPSGVISGTPTGAGMENFVVEASDSTGLTITKDFTMTVAPAPVVSFQAYWALDEGNGENLKDSLSGGNDLQLKGGEWVTGYMGGALRFAGKYNYAYRTDADLSGAFPAKGTGGAEDFTLAAWIMLDKANTRNPIICKQGNGKRGFLFLVEDSNKLSMQIFNKSGVRSDVFSSTVLKTGQWYHVAVTYDYVSDGNSSLKLYVNGVSDGSNNASVGPVVGNSEPLEVGRYYWSGSYNRYMNGVVDEIQLFDRTLSMAETAELAGN